MGRLRSTSGFSMIELMIVLAILAILSYIAVASYTSYVERARLTEATEVLSGLRLRMEQSFSDNRTYAGTGVDPCAINNFTTDSFALTCASNSAFEYTWTATALGDSGVGEAGDYVYTANQAAVATTASYKGTDYSPEKDCWITRKTQVSTCADVPSS